MQKRWMILVGITIQTDIDMVWLSKSWEWLKKNWKYVATFGIPVLLSFIAGLLRSNRSLEKKVELEQDLREVDNEANALENRLQQQASDTRKEVIEKVIEDHKDTLEAIAEDERNKINSIADAESATAAIKEKLNENIKTTS